MALTDEDERLDAGRGRRRMVGVLIVLVVLAGVVAVVLFAGRSLLNGLGQPGDYPGPGTGRAVVQVHPGDSAGQIGASLVSKGVVKSVRAFSSAAAGEPRSRQLQPGFYSLRRQMSGKQALALLLDPSARLRGRVTVPEGSSLSSTLTRLARDTDVKRAALVAALRTPARLGLPAYAKGRPEGFLFPATYDAEPGSTAVALLRLMTTKFAEEASAVDLVTGSRAVGRSPYEVVTVASLVEAETPLDEDRAKVARVVYNRLRRRMPLQLDSTVNYIRAERAARLSLADISVSSPYNTYRNKGLPPTPIDSPGRAALLGALHPAAGDWLYFITVDKQGHSLFTSDYQAFLKAKAKAQRDGVY